MTMSPSTARTISLPELLTQVSREFGSMAGAIERLQDTISGLLCEFEITPDLLEQAQALDQVFQHMTQLGDIVARTAGEASVDWKVPTNAVLAQVSLSALAGRLSGQTHVAPASGDMEMF